METSIAVFRGKEINESMKFVEFRKSIEFRESMSSGSL